MRSFLSLDIHKCFFLIKHNLIFSIFILMIIILYAILIEHFMRPSVDINNISRQTVQYPLNTYITNRLNQTYKCIQQSVRSHDIDYRLKSSHESIISPHTCVVSIKFYIASLSISSKNVNILPHNNIWVLIRIHQLYQ